jgi:hypothetical protein
MNGRVFDYRSGRFLSVDPIVQAPGNSQSLNPYSYVFNNPLSGTDPSGYASVDAGSICARGAGVCGAVLRTDGLAAMSAMTVNRPTLSQQTQMAVDRTAAFSVGVLRNGADGGQGANGAGGAANQQADASDKGAQGNREYSVPVDGVHRATPPSFSDYMRAGANATNDPVARLAEGVLTSGAELYTAVTGGFGGDGNNPYTGDYMNREERVSAIGQNIFFSLIGLGGRGSSVMAAAAEFKGLCFVEGTPVHTDRGLVPIEQIREGDIVAAKDELSGEVVWSPFVRLFRNADQEIVWVSMVREDGTTEYIGATLEHPFWVDEKGWVPANSLQSGDKLVRLHGGAAAVESVAYQAEREATYNFEVTDVHTYFVGESGVWVHNQSKSFLDVVEAGLSSRAARREAMRDAGIPTSQQPVSQSRNASGREYSYDVPAQGGGMRRMSVQQQTMDRSHEGQPHWEAGPVKIDRATGDVRMNRHGRPALRNDKSKVDY